MIRNQYTFGRPLTTVERDLLGRLISWRRGSRVITDDSGAVVACVGHPDDIDAFEKEVRKLNGVKLRAVQVAPERMHYDDNRRTSPAARRTAVGA